MKFSELIRHLDTSGFIKIYIPNSEDKPEFEGGVLDIPWYFLDYVLDTDENGEYEAIWVGTYTTKSGTKLPAICIKLT